MFTIEKGATLDWKDKEPEFVDIQPAPATSAIQQQPVRVPWARRIYRPQLDSLNEEIIDLAAWLKPQPIETYLRSHVFNRVAIIIGRIWPTAQCCLFGSVATNMFLPSSDLDISVQLEPGLDMKEICRHLRRAAKEFE